MSRLSVVSQFEGQNAYISDRYGEIEGRMDRLRNRMGSDKMPRLTAQFPKEMTMHLAADPDVQAVAEFMLKSIPAARLVSVAAGLNAMAPLLWGWYQAEEVCPLRLLADDLHTPPAASGSLLEPSNAHGDFEEAAGASR